VLTTMERTFKAVADRSRLRILKLLQGEGELCVCQIAATLGLDQSTVSRHLAVLRNAGFVEDRREGRWTYYRISDAAAATAHVHRILELIGSCLDEDDRILSDRIRCRQVKLTPVDRLCADVAKRATRR